MWPKAVLLWQHVECSYCTCIDIIIFVKLGGVIKGEKQGEGARGRERETEKERGRERERERGRRRRREEAKSNGREIKRERN